MVERIAWVPARHHKMTGLGEICGALETLTAADDTCRLVTLADVHKQYGEVQSRLSILGPICQSPF
jgi:hypothetical protein